MTLKHVTTEMKQMNSSSKQSKQSVSGVVLNSNKSPNESFQSSGMETINGKVL